ncbi:MAG: type II toxin-antitoxin system VapC family toxin [Desulfobacterales bacterium]|nr:type II toxin-antitoxin system VapC family toxin [Desulfobacterales bacterium]
MFVLDTNTLIYFFKGEGRVAERLLSVSPQEIGLPSMVLFELEVGIAKSTRPEKRTRQLEEMLALIQVLPFGLEEARCAALIRAELERQGSPIGPYDILIAATAMVRGAILVTRNTREFERIQGLRLQDWFGSP